MSEQQIAKLAGAIVEHQSNFASMAVEDRQWAIQNTASAIGLFADAVKGRNTKTAQDTRVIVLNPTTIAVNLAATPKLPFNGAEVEQHIGEGWAVVEKRPDGLYVNGRKVILHLSKRQLGGKQLKGHELRDELTGKPVLNANLLDALYDSPHLIPEDWKADENGNTRYIFFWGSIFRDAYGNLCVRYLYFDVGVWYRYYAYWLDYGWLGRRPAALLASS